MRHERLIFDNDEAAHLFHRNVGQGAMMAVGALRAAHCDELALVLQDHAEWLADQYFEHFRERLTPEAAAPKPPAPTVITGVGSGTLTGGTGSPVETPPAPPLPPLPSPPAPPATSPSTAKPKRQRAAKAPASPPEAPPPPSEPDIEAQAIVFSEGDLAVLRKFLAGLTCGTKEGQRHMQVARAAVGFTGFLPEATEDEVRKLAKEVKLLQLRNAKFEGAHPPAPAAAKS